MSAGWLTGSSDVSDHSRGELLDELNERDAEIDRLRLALQEALDRASAAEARLAAWSSHRCVVAARAATQPATTDCEAGFDIGCGREDCRTCALVQAWLEEAAAVRS